VEIRGLASIRTAEHTLVGAALCGRPYGFSSLVSTVCGVEAFPASLLQVLLPRALLFFYNAAPIGTQEAWMGEHYSPEEIEEALSGRLDGKRSKEIVRHLLSGCPHCQAAARQSLYELNTVADSLLPPALSTAHNTVLDRAEDFARRAASLQPEERSRFRKALSLLETGGGVVALAHKGDLEIEGLGIYEALLARSWALRYENPREMCHLAKVAVEVAHGLDSGKYSVWKLADCASRAWGELANAYRVADRLRAAEQAFIQAYKFFDKGTRDRGLLMRLLDLEASLLGARREFGRALKRLTTLSSMYRAAGETHLTGRTLITKALYLYYEGNSQEACRALEEGLGLIDKDRDPSLIAASALNQLLLLEDSGRLKDARMFLFNNRARITQAGNLLALRLRGIEGRINYGMGLLDNAERDFRVVREGFREAGMSFACALMGLEIALTLLRQGRTQEAIQEGLVSAKMFLSLKIGRELLGSFLFLEEAFKSEVLNLADLEETARYLRRMQIVLGLK
jgi:tetratricopeptide (TPR) repeat protein